jgi:hypothetical protein
MLYHLDIHKILRLDIQIGILSYRFWFEAKRFVITSFYRNSKNHLKHNLFIMSNIIIG